MFTLWVWLQKLNKKSTHLHMSISKLKILKNCLILPKMFINFLLKNKNPKYYCSCVHDIVFW